MTMTTPDTESPQAEVATPAETSLETAQPEAAPQEAGVGEQQQSDATSPPPEPEYDFLDTDELGEKYVKVKVDGEELVVPLREALNGYSREQDYTRKRQADADALRLAQAVQQNPGLTMQVLAAQNGMTVEQFLNLTPQQQQQAAATQPPSPEEIPPTDPVERQLWEQDRRLAAVQAELAQRDANDRLERVMAGLRQQHGATDEDLGQAVQAAIQLGQQQGRSVPPEMLPMIYQALQYQKVQGQQQGQQQHAAQQAAENAARQAQAQAASETIGTGSGAPPSGHAPAPVAGQPMTPAQAAAAALDQYGL